MEKCSAIDSDKSDAHLQEVKLTIDQYEMLIKSMASRSRDVPPLTMRSQRQTHPVPVTALCSYKYLNVRICLSYLSFVFCISSCFMISL